MTPPITMLIQMTVPRMLSDHFGTPAEVKAYLQTQGIWPNGVQVDRWRLNTTTPGYLVELEVTVPLPQPAGRT